MKALVTGGGGFLGKAIVKLLLTRGDEARSFSRGDYPELATLGVEQFRGDLADKEALFRAAAGCNIVFHVAAKSGIWGSYADFYRANVTGTENVIAACRRLGIGRLVYTGSPSAVFDGRDVEGGDESLHYPEHYEAHYPATKAMAERLVLAANSSSLATVSLRPHLIWGPGDNHLVPRIVARGKAGKLRRIGSRPCLVDTVYVDNAARAHLLAGDCLARVGTAAGKAYFISNGEPLPLWEMVNRILACAGLPPVTRSIPAKAAYAIGACCEGIWRTLRLSGEPPMTRFVAREMATSHWFDISAARRDLGYHPEISIDEGLVRLKEWLSREKT
jgi:nucleoside-diphosphate-sugar epimerase